MAPDRADEASPRPDPPPPQQPLSLPLPDPDRRRRLPPHRSPVVSHRPSTPSVSLSLAPNLRLSVLHPDPDPRWRPPIQPLPSSPTARARVQHPESQASISSSAPVPKRLCLPVPPEDGDDTSSGWISPEDLAPPPPPPYHAAASYSPPPVSGPAAGSVPPPKNTMDSVKDVLGKMGKRFGEAARKTENITGNFWQHHEIRFSSSLLCGFGLDRIINALLFRACYAFGLR
ncbi:hypothetical protein VPH35_041578 [Triticum aestivum]